MVPGNELRKIGRARLKDADILYNNRRYDSAVYLCGYAIELFLKARICRTLKWAGYPSTRSEFQSYQSFRTHDLNVLLNLSGLRSKINARYFTEWSDVITWNPEIRYEAVGVVSQSDASIMIESTRTLLGAI
ncbi:MAG TPA: HEPN domain-containing protein [Desulfobacterales bacterium]|nr:HEPN domain-containing protein [Desulfobacterales bacterium]